MRRAWGTTGLIRMPTTTTLLAAIAACTSCTMSARLVATLSRMAEWMRPSSRIGRGMGLLLAAPANGGQVTLGHSPTEATPRHRAGRVDNRLEHQRSATPHPLGKHDDHLAGRVDLDALGVRRGRNLAPSRLVRLFLRKRVLDLRAQRRRLMDDPGHPAATFDAQHRRTPHRRHDTH